jgi:hypothetical protein
LAGELADMDTSSKAIYLTEISEFLVAAGQVDALAELVGEEGLRRRPLIDVQCVHARALLLAHEGDWEGAEWGFARAVEALRPMHVPFLLGRSLTRHGHLLIDQGRREEALPMLREALSLFVGLRAEPWVARVEELQALVGAR